MPHDSIAGKLTVVYLTNELRLQPDSHSLRWIWPETGGFIHIRGYNERTTFCFQGLEPLKHLLLQLLGEAGAYLTIKGLNQHITIMLDSPRPHLMFCIGALIENVNGIIKIQKIDEYVIGHRECDAMFGFNFRWLAGSKD